MIIALFSLIAWITIVAFLFIPKAYTLVENLIVLFVIIIIVSNLFPIVTLDLQLVQYSYAFERFVSLCLYRNLIAPLILLAYANGFYQTKTVIKKLFLTFFIFVALYLLEYLTIWTGIRKYTGWNDYLTICLLAALMVVTVYTGRGLKLIQQ